MANEFEQYGCFHFAGAHVGDDPNQPEGLALRVSYVGHTPLVNGKRYELTLSAAYIERDPLGVSAAAPTPTFDPPGPVTIIHQGHIRPFFFIMRGFVVQKPQLLCVRAHFRSVDDVGRVNKIDIGDNFAIFVVPLQN